MTKKELYTNKYPISDQAFYKEIISHTEIKKFKKNTVFLKQEESDNSIYFLKSGVVIASEIYPSGKKICLGIYDKPGDILVGGLGPNNLYSPVNMEAKTICEVFAIQMEDIQRYLTEYPETVFIYNKIMTAEYEKQWQIKNMLYLDSAEDRYRWFLEKYPGTIDKINHEIIASFLHMSPVTLSRVRRKIEEDIV